MEGNDSDKGVLRDDGESVALMEPLLIRQDLSERGELQDLAFTLVARSAGLKRALPPGLREALAGLVRSMNCYYSNLIEGHNTHPVDIERALASDFSADAKQRDLQLEARAHIRVQEWIDSGGAEGRASSAELITEIHKRFCSELPADLLKVEDPHTGTFFEVVPGTLRTRDVEVGRHRAVSPGAVPRFLQRFEEAYSRLGKAELTLSVAVAHHRLLWIHPFLDGNGRVARLLSHAQLLDAVDSCGLWSIARGFARNVAKYKEHLAHCDMTRRNDLDGRGHLSEEAMLKFTRFVLEICIDQVTFMEELIRPDLLHSRVRRWAEEEVERGELSTKAKVVLEALLYRGELPRGELPSLLEVTPRQARRILSQLFEKKVVASESSRSPIHLAFPAYLADRWMPGLFPAL